MAVSAADSLSQIPGFRDRLGERVIVPQQSGALLEFLHFSDPLATAPFFAQATKDRIARLTNFRHSSYCRVRRLQSVIEREGRPALVSGHVAGRRLAEVLDVAARTDLKPSTSGVLAVTRQLMASVALLHDFAPDGFHGALGPDRLILAGEGRVVVAEHVLGTFVEEAAGSWGVARLWQDFRLAVLPEPKSAQYGRRVDVVQVGLVALSMLLGRPLAGPDYPQALPQLIAEVEETTPDGTHVPLRAPLRGWLERTLNLRSDSPFRTLLEAQKAFSQLLQEEDYGASSVAWEAFVGVCETAALRVPVVVVTPEPLPIEVVSQEAITPVAHPASEPAVDHPATPTAITLTAADQLAGFALNADQADESAPIPVSFPGTAEAGSGSDAEAVARLREDPFGPWPVATPAGSAATLLDSFDVPTAPPMGAAALAAAVTEPERSAPDPWAVPAATAPPDRVEPRAETLFETPQSLPIETPAQRPAAAQAVSWEEPKPSSTTSVADWRTRDRAQDLSYLVLNEGREAAQDTGVEAAPLDEEPSFDPARRKRLVLLIALVLVATAAAAFAPYAWKVVFEGRLVFGTLRVDSDPPGAVISVDGQVRGHTPVELLLKEGEHLLELQIGGSAKSKNVSISANRTISEKMTFPEAGERGGLMITTYPAKGKISVDGVGRGEAPLKITDLQPGTHTLLVETPHGSQEQDVVVQPGRVAQLAVPTVSWIKVNSPFELTVYEDGRQLGTVGKAPVMISPGRRNLDFVNKSVGLKLRHYVDAVAGQVVTVPLDMPTGMMNLYSDQPADVLVDGAVVGQTPLPSLQVPLGPHEVVFRHPKYGEVRYTVAVTLTAPVKLTVTFRK